MKAALSSIVTLLALGCASAHSSPSTSEPLSFKEIQTICDWEIGNELECEKLNFKKVDLVGAVYYIAPQNTATLFAIGTIIPHNDDDPIWEKMPDYDLVLMVGNDINLQAELMSLHQKPIRLTGSMNTECLTKSRLAQEATDRRNKEAREAGLEDEIIITMLTGFCHYHSVFVSDFKISELE